MEMLTPENKQSQMEVVINNTIEYAKKELMGESSGHDWWHTYRVLQTATRIGEQEGADLNIIKLTALLHDVGDYKLHGGGETIGPKLTTEWLQQQKVDEETISRICEIIETMSFKGAKVDSIMKTKEGMCVQDADRLDAIGAIGIGRTFAYHGSKGWEMHNPEINPTMHRTFQEYKASQGSTINHFYEKLLLLKNLMNAETGKRMAESRHKYMEGFLDRFLKEWEGEL